MREIIEGLGYLFIIGINIFALVTGIIYPIYDKVTQQHPHKHINYHPVTNFKTISKPKTYSLEECMQECSKKSCIPNHVSEDGLFSSNLLEHIPLKKDYTFKECSIIFQQSLFK